MSIGAEKAPSVSGGSARGEDQKTNGEEGVQAMSIVQRKSESAQRELRELNSLFPELAFVQARIAAAAERLLDTGHPGILTTPRYSVENRGRMQHGTTVHVIREEKRAGRKNPDGSTWEKYRVHPADECDGLWCHEDRRARRGGDTEFWFAYEGVWTFAAWHDDTAVLVADDEVTS